ncbi:unnamed protein product [Paramecium sonneborni]|uniref:Uncharacterized protein n=1 Tax=Paramecium sonneborni TaxID=65129 RepID=A0A8S1KHT5_9CILI|nr:unnamed protein product [Paramecium sonneborni]
MTEENKRPHLKKLLTFLTEAPSKTIQRTKTISITFAIHLTKPVTQVSKLKRFFTLSFAIVKEKTNQKIENFQSNLQKTQNDKYLHNSSKFSWNGKLNIQQKRDNEQNEDKNQQKVDHLKRCLTPQSRIENNCNSSLAISQLDDQLIDRNAASFANMTLELSMNTNVLYQMALPSKDTNQSHRELNFDVISNPILEKSESQENIIIEQNQDGIIEQEQNTQQNDQQTNKNFSKIKFKQAVNLVETYNIVTKTYRHKQKLLEFIQQAPVKIVLKSKIVFSKSQWKLIIKGNSNAIQNNDIKEDNNNKNQLNNQEQILLKEKNLVEILQQDATNQNDNQQQQVLMIKKKISEFQPDQLNKNTTTIQNINQNNPDLENDSKKHQKSVVNFIAKSGTLMKKKTIDMFQQIENKLKVQEVQKLSFVNQQSNIESNKNEQEDKDNVNQFQTKFQNQNQNSDQDEYQVDPYLEEQLKISKQYSNKIEKNDQFNYKDENSNQMNDFQANSRGELYSNDKLPQEITHIEKKSFHQDSSDTSQMFDIIQKSCSENQKSKINIQDNQSNQQSSKLFNKDMLKQEYEEINQEIQQLNIQKQQLLPKRNVLIKSTFKPNYKKMAEISDDNEALYKAKDLVRKMNQNRKDKEERSKFQYEKIEKYFHNLQYLKESQEEMQNRYEQQRKQQIQNRIEDYQKKQKEFSQLQKISHNFVQKLINVGPQQGQLAKEFEDNVISIKGGYRKVKLKNLGIELPKINGNNNNPMFRRYMNEEVVKSKQDEMIRKYEASKQALFKSID